MFSSETNGIIPKTGIPKALGELHMMPVISEPHDFSVSADHRSHASDIKAKNGASEVKLTVKHIGKPEAAHSLSVEDAVTVVLPQFEKVNVETGVLETPKVPFEKSVDETESNGSKNISQGVGEDPDVHIARENISKSGTESDQEPKPHSDADDSSTTESRGFTSKISRMYIKQMARVAVFKEDWRQMEEASAPRPNDEDYEPEVVTWTK